MAPDAPGTGSAGHTPVLPAEVLSVLEPRRGETYADLTAGLGGHARLIAPRVGPEGVVVLFDMDPANLARAERNVREVFTGRLLAFHANFAHAPRILGEQGLRADAVLADLGFASTQVDDPVRGLSFQRDGPLDMRLDPTLERTAADLVRTLPEDELARVLAEFGEEPGARRIARKLAAARLDAPITTTGQLALLVRQALGVAQGSHAGRTDPATRTFQALRIAVNSELDTLDALMCSIEREARSAHAADSEAHGTGWLAPGARIAIISFHSLEDRPVKQAFARLCTPTSFTPPSPHSPAGFSIPFESPTSSDSASGSSAAPALPLTRKPLVATEEECRTNPRSRSAKLRAIRLS